MARGKKKQRAEKQPIQVDPRVKTAFTAQTEQVVAPRPPWTQRPRNRYALLFCVVAAAIAIALAILAVMLPSCQSNAAQTKPQPTEGKETQVLVGEVLMYLPYATDPWICDNEVLLSEGKLTASAPRMQNLYIANLDTGEQKRLQAVVPENDEFVRLQMSDDYIAMVDANATRGNGIIKVIDRATEEVRAVATCPYNVPQLTLEDNMLAWVARTGNNTDCLYVMDLTTSESVAVYLYTDDALGTSPPWIYGGRLYWATPDDTGERRGIGMVRSISLDGKAKQEIYQPGTYVFGPQGNGEAIAWIDGNRGEKVNLYISVDDGPARLVAQDVVGYGLGEDFLAYCVNERVYVYMYRQNKTLPVNQPDEKAVFSCVCRDTVVWFDVTNDRVDRDIVLYAKIQ